ncbi:SGNH/GDSL hydrolase family protein [Mesobacillus foraminis]|uniref:SGNH/GDSL hydrolase family protein n=1 Tax=Mesobacillus foraminis TaxID=279826 RepID=UPI0013CE7E15|nr:SGNH/GDSL hydrolase family protein [Mesobacillus foraminis]
MKRNKLGFILMSVLFVGVICSPLDSVKSAAAEKSGKKGEWIGAWSASQTAAWETVDWDGGTSRKGFANQTIRMVIHPNASGSAVRIRLSNQFGTKPITFGKVTVGSAKKGAEAVNGSVKPLTFAGKQSVTIPKGEEVFSDPVPFEVHDGSDLMISLYIHGESGPATWHNTSNSTTYISTQGDFAAESDDSAFTGSFDAWFWLSGVDVKTNNKKRSRVIVALGDSITDGYLSTLNENRRWTDVLNDRLDSEIKNQNFTVLNQGISGNRILSDSPIFGEKALARLDRDVFSQTGVTDLILLEGINDIGHEPHVHDANRIIEGIKEIAARAHERGIKIYAGTLTPFKGYDEGVYYTEEGEQTRQEVNAWIRSSHMLDGFIDFDRALADPNDHEKFRKEYDSGDALHPNDLGLKVMGESIDLSIFEKPLTGKAELHLIN